MITNAKNKMQGVEKTKTAEEVYHFPGNGEYEPINIEAANLDEAAERWKEARKPVQRQATE